MSMIERIKEKARADRKTIVFPEGLEPRTVKACAILKAEGIADPVLLGKPEDILREAEELHADLTGDYAAVPEEMKAVAAVFGKTVLREVDEVSASWIRSSMQNFRSMRRRCMSFEK